ncbi:cytochrome c [Chitinophaga sp. sic0106]|uniref:c-type cytochrome n=1 Tax=Chitinophaga sp. sic0106 TaxID=2854785 RepID=UPI00351CC2D9
MKPKLMGKAPVRKLAFQHPKFLIIAALAGLVIGLTANGLNYDKQIRKTATNRPDSIASVAAFGKVYKVLKSPRCMNCHPAGNIPLQGDDSHLHTMSPIRGKDGKGVYAMKCANCHQATNSPGVGTPPGNPNWALPPEDMKMVFQGKSARELALQIMDYKRNGHKNKAQLIAHARDTLVKAGWNMGDGRKPPPIAYKEFVAAWDEWINKGGYAPGK